MRFFRLRRTGFITDKLTVHINKSNLQRKIHNIIALKMPGTFRICSIEMSI